MQWIIAWLWLPSCLPALVALSTCVLHQHCLNTPICLHRLTDGRMRWHYNRFQSVARAGTTCYRYQACCMMAAIAVFGNGCAGVFNVEHLSGCGNVLNSNELKWKALKDTSVTMKHGFAPLVNLWQCTSLSLVGLLIIWYIQS